MRDARRQTFILSIVIFLHTITLLNAKHHHKHNGPQCRTAWSSIQAQFKFNHTAPAALNSSATLNAPTALGINLNSTLNATSHPADTNTQRVDIIGIPWQYAGEPIQSDVGQQKQLITVTPPKTNQTGQSVTIPEDQYGFPCINAGVLFSCSKCVDILTGRDCYKKIGPDQLDTVGSGDVRCDLWYTRTGYGVGGGVTMCGTKSGEVFQCSSDKGLSECGPCLELGTTSPS